MQPAIVVMSRVPKPGATKTRLMAKLSGEECAAVHLACLQDICQAINKAHVQGYVYFTGDTDPDIDLPANIVRRTQRGVNLGQRLHCAAGEALAEHYKVILLGADLPDITLELVEKALHMLDQYDIVIGPALDGGYYLLGIKQAHPELFSDIEWGSSKVLRQTIDQIYNLGLSYCLLESKRDLDRWEDLIQFYQESTTRCSEHSCLLTFHVVKRLMDKYRLKSN